MKIVKTYLEFLNEAYKMSDFKVGMNVTLANAPDVILKITLIQPNTIKGMEEVGSIHVKDEKTGGEGQCSPGYLIPAPATTTPANNQQTTPPATNQNPPPTNNQQTTPPAPTTTPPAK